MLLYSLLPLVLVIILLVIYRLDIILLITVFFVPLSLPLRQFSGDIGSDLYLPTELLLAAILFVVLLKRIQGERFNSNLLSHPVSLAIYFNLAWILVTAVSSTMPVVSFKFFLSRLWFVVGFYFLAAEIFRNHKNISRYLWMYIIPLLLVIGYTVVRHINIGLFDQEAAHYVMGPFYNDHTSYGAILAMMIPVAVGFLLDIRQPFWYRFFTLVVLLILVAAIILSFSRAAWVSLIFAAGVLIIVLLKIRFHILLLLAVIIVVFVLNRLESITYEMEKNRQQSSANLSEHVQSISNITTDDSNMERLNRWSCAWRMFLEKPLFGWGPGTYMFQYAPFQISREKTTISTNMADRGNAHSEYLGPLSESGFLGMISVLLVISITLYTGFKTYWKLKEIKHRALLLSVMLGLITYYVHGILNNFLDTDKASAPFWGYTAIIVAMDIYLTRNEDKAGRLNSALSSDPLTEDSV
jgi:O-antigen ligase